MDKSRGRCYRAEMPSAPNPKKLRPRHLAWGLAGALAALVPCAIMWGFTVDDALISVRYARHLASGSGYRFNAGGPVTDGVTPLPWAFVLAPLAKAAALDVLMRAKCMGLLLWTAVASWLGVAVGRRGGWLAAAALAALAVSLPVAAHAVSGMETALAMALATAAVLCMGRRTCAVLAGLAAAFRPEMAPWAAVLAFGDAWAGETKGEARLRPLLRAFIHAGIALAPFLACTAARLLVFGRPAPLALLAKPSDVAHGAVYAAAALLVTATPALILAPAALARGPARAKVIAAAAFVHVAAIIAVGGDWMPYARLLAPIAPSLAWAYVLLLPYAHRASSLARAVIALGLGAFFFVRTGPAGRTVMADRRALIEAARPRLAASKTVAALDIGWVSAATEATIVDLAGVTDLDIAVLPGGHTSKRVDASLVLSRGTDALLFYIPAGVGEPPWIGWRNAHYGHVVEARLARSDLIAAHFEPRAFLPLGPVGAGYLMLGRRTNP